MIMDTDTQRIEVEIDPRTAKALLQLGGTLQEGLRDVIAHWLNNWEEQEMYCPTPPRSPEEGAP